ncbi:hypothetical protein GQ42DRAFT_165524, partial [Ramicandelaber brevisporus]
MGKRNNIASSKKPSNLLLLCQVKSSESIDSTPPSSITDEAPTELLPGVLNKSGKTGQGSKVDQKLIADMSLTEADKKKLSPIMSKRSNTDTNADSSNMDSDAVGRKPWAPKSPMFFRYAKLSFGGFNRTVKHTGSSKRKSCLPNY